MDKETRASLLKQFSLILKNRSKDETYQKLTLSLGEYYSRKDLIDILKKKYGDYLPEELNLMECENKDLLSLIGDDMCLISHTTGVWASEKPVSAQPQNQIVVETDTTKQEPIIPSAKKDIPTSEQQKPVTPVKPLEKKK